MQYFVLLLLLIPFNFNKVEIRSDKIIEQRLVVEKKEYATTEKIGFWLQADEDIKVETMSCACGDKDFTYSVFKKDKSKNTSKVYRRHLEDENTDKCACLYLNATLVNSVVYYIEPIKEKGIYYLEIKDVNGYVYVSGEFVVK